ncbi:MAG: SMP-30/gluconolactonase/LRE family protein [Fidelibacterota bacterium]
MKILKSIGMVVLIIILYLCFWPVEINPAVWEPMPAPELTGDYSPNSYLQTTEILARGDGIGPEDIDVDNEGRIYAPFEDGRIMRYDKNGQHGQEFVNTEGRPLGMDFNHKGNLIVCDAKKGLLSIAPDGQITSLTTEANGVPFVFTDDVDIAKDGTIYFTDASSNWKISNYRADIIEHRAYGRLLAYYPKTKQTKVIKDKLYFANGVAVSPDQQFVLVNETSEYRIQKIWIAGEKTGTSEVLMENLPGIPDGISSNGKGVFWVAFPSKRKDIIDNLADKPFIRKMIMRLPESMQPAPDRYGFIMGIDENGNVIHNLQDPSPESFSPITSVEEHNGYLYLGSLTYEGFGRIKAPE